ncbi:hypothetical protein B0H19DRAFT_1274835 [Mycena capillaripes]|nr:hypothetical protein B0H19DRAFT_1274835 [Mycena capillaripes]
MPQPSSVRPHKLCRGVGIYTTGLVVTQAQMTKISLRVCDEDFLVDYGGDPVLVLKWRVSDHNYELIPLENGNLAGPHLFAISFFPYLKEAAPSDKLFSRLCSLSDEQKNTWHDLYGKHTDMALKDHEPFTMRYPTNGAAAHFLGQELQHVINANKELWEFLVPLPSLSAKRFSTQVPVS